MNRLSIFFSSVMAGVSIAFGGTVFLASENKVVGAALFTVGLFLVCNYGFHLFTGKVYSALQKDRRYLFDLPVIWIGNFVGTWLTAQVILLTRMASLSEKARVLSDAKAADSLVSLFFLGALCNIFIFIAVDGFNRLHDDIGRYLALFFGIMVFILCGYEHCVADMYYFSLAGALNGRTLMCLAVITAGNACGGILFCEAVSWLRRRSAPSTK
ncbi:MAG: formate/nitrite transporter family protein [Pyramidobacter sp.]|jgi:formate/nitrite transporter FocA (FNT family)